MSNILFIPDLHEPFAHRNAIKFCLYLCKKYKIDRVVSAGDVGDFHAFSLKWGPDPNGRSPGDEYELLMESMLPWYREFPHVEVCHSNHDARPYKKIFAANLPHQFVKSMGDFMRSPKGWIWLQGGIEIDGVQYYHGENLSQANWRMAFEKAMKPVAHGHLHNTAGVHYHVRNKKTYFVMNGGCLIDEDQYCFRYSQYNFNRACIGAGIVIDGQQAIWEPMPSKMI